MNKKMVVAALVSALVLALPRAAQAADELAKIAGTREAPNRES